MFITQSGAKRAKQKGAVAQLGEHLPCTQGVRSSILLGSTKYLVVIGFVKVLLSIDFVRTECILRVYCVLVKQSVKLGFHEVL